MESRANYLLVGSFVLIAFAAAFAFVIWLTRVQLHQDVNRYEIFFEGTVQGLGIGGDVLYRGIRIGSITELAIDETDPSRVGVVVDLSARNPIREGDFASLQYQALTGIAAIDIEGAAAGSPTLSPQEPGGIAQIPSKLSGFEQLVESAPQLLSRGIVLADRASELLREENQILITSILNDVDAITTTLASRRENIASTLAALEKASNDLALGAGDFQATVAKIDTFVEQAGGALENLETTLAHADTLLAKDAKLLVGDVRSAAQSVDDLARQANRMLSRNEESLDYFANDFVLELGRFLTDSRLLIASMGRVVERLETDGARFLIGERDAEFRAE